MNSDVEMQETKEGFDPTVLFLKMEGKQNKREL